jgi:prolyl-tRNA editing enzyme YbaK/EbsC (Cys-tRNA(Pro) deacylase)
MTSIEGTLNWKSLDRHTDLVAPPVAAALAKAPSARVARIDPDLADTAVFCEAYGSALDHSANCVVVAGRRSGEIKFAAVMVLATMRADINNVVRRHLDVRKISFAPLDEVVPLTGMQYGGITAIGLPDDWPVLIDEAVAAAGTVVIGSGIRGSKLLVASSDLVGLPRAEVLQLAL